VIIAKSPKHVTTNFGTCDNQPRIMGLIVIFSQFYLKLNNLFVQ